MLVVSSTAFAVLRVKFEGEDLGSNVASILNKEMRGRIAIGSIEWSVGSLETVVTGGWVPITLRDVRVWDDCALSQSASGPAGDALRTGDPNEDCTPDDKPDADPSSKRKPRKLLVRTDRVTAEIDIHALMFGDHRFRFRNVWVHGGEALLEETREPYPLHAYDRKIVSIVTAFYPRMNAGFRAGISAGGAPPVFDLQDIHIENLNLTVHMNPYSVKGPDRIGYSFTARLEGVNVDADRDELTNGSYLYMDPRDPLVAKFYVRLAATAERGLARVFDEGPRAAFRLPHPGATRLLGPGVGPSPLTEVYPPVGRAAEYAVTMTDVRLNRLAQLPTSWASRNFVANSLELDLEAKSVPCATDLMPSPDPAQGASLHLAGELHSWWDRPYDGSWDLKLAATNLGPTIRTCIKPTAGGDDLDGTITLSGPFVASPKIGLAFTNLDVDVPLNAKEEPIRLTLAEVRGGIDLVNEQGYIDLTRALIRGGKEPGEVELSATFGLRPYNGNAQVNITKAIDIGRFLPVTVTKPVGRFVKGAFRVRGDAEQGLSLEEFNLSLGATPESTALRVHKGKLLTDDDFDTIHIENVFVEAGRSHAMIDGRIDVAHGRFDRVTITGEFPDIGVWLKRFGLPQLFQSAGGGTIVLDGPITRPKIRGNTTLGGVPCIDRLQLVDVDVEGDLVDIHQMTSPGLGGRLTGSGQIRIGDTPRIERLRLLGSRLDASKLCGAGKYVKGTIDSVDAELTSVTIDKNRELVDWLDYAEVFAKAEHLSVRGDGYSRIAMCVNRKDDKACRPRSFYLDADDISQCAEAKRQGACIVTTATRDAGGQVDATIAKFPATRTGKARASRIAGSIGVDLPVAVLDQLLGKKVVGGSTHLALHLAGTTAAPQASGNIDLLRAWVYDAFLGDSQITIEPATLPGGKPAIAFRGSAMSDRIKIAGTLGTTAPYPLELSVTGRRVEIDVIKNLKDLIPLSDPMQAWVSGTVTYKTELVPAKPVEPEIWVELSELVGIVNHRGADGRLTPIRLSVLDENPGSRPAVSVRVTPTSLELACKDSQAPGGRAPCSTKIATPAGVVEVRGHATMASMAIEALGMLDLSLIAPLLDNTFDAVSGNVALSASISGTFVNPTYQAALDLDPDGLWQSDPARANPVRLRPIGGDTVIEIPSGLIKLANGSLGFTNVLAQVRDQHIDEKGELQVGGNIAMDGLTPTKWGLLISGKLAGQMLLVLAPGLVSQAGGLAAIDGYVTLQGTGRLPLVAGRLSFDPPAEQPQVRARPFTLIPRGMRHELVFTGGGLEIATTTTGTQRTYTLGVEDVTASIDGEGMLTGIDGLVHLRDSALVKLDLGLNVDNVSIRWPGTLDVVFSAPQVRGRKGIQISKLSEFSPLSVGGTIAIIDGAYKRGFELSDQLTALRTNRPPGKPWWEEYPTLANALLNLDLNVLRFGVKNNIATIDLAGRIKVSNTPRDPRLSGSIRVERGEFKIPQFRARFTRTSGSIDFAENQNAGDPELNLTSEADYRDLTAQDH
ncbi:MAG: translocation/assembly module TamB domain-containing protein, partial [Kofleriaceae bacterium]